MNKKIFIAIFFTIFLIFLMFFLITFINKSLNNYSWTKAICNETHCQDYEIMCDGKNIISKTPITGAIIYLSNNWEDPRDNGNKEESCVKSNIFKSYFID
jgi:hypothetical protein